VGGLTTGIVAAAISAPIAAGVFGGVTGSGTDALVALFRTLGLNVFQSTFAQGLTSDPLDKTISYTIVFVILAALPLTVRTMFSRGEATIAD
jgi:energy-coupling factor transport system substrate-specific component